MGIKILKYGFETRNTFKEEIKRMRVQEKMTYGMIANALHKLGFRNRDGRKITAQFVGNVLTRYIQNRPKLKTKSPTRKAAKKLPTVKTVKKTTMDIKKKKTGTKKKTTRKKSA